MDFVVSPFLTVRPSQWASNGETVSLVFFTLRLIESLRNTADISAAESSLKLFPVLRRLC